MIEKVLKRIPLAMCIIGKRRSGKTKLLIDMLNSKYFKKTFDQIFLFSPTVSLDKSFESVKNEAVVGYDFYSEEVIEDILKLQKMKGDNRKDILIILDDLAEKLKGRRGNVLEQLATKGRHFNCSFIFTSQKYNAIPTVIRNNTDEIIFFRVSNNQELKTISEEYQSKDLTIDFEDLLYSQTKGYDYLLIVKGKQDSYYRGNKLDYVKLNFTKTE